MTHATWDVYAGAALAILVIVAGLWPMKDQRR